ncbi:MAG: dUTP diphosphatase [Ferruginibacter sp.]
MVSIKIINQSDNSVPAYATAGAAGLDVRAFLSSSVTLQPLQRHLVPTGLFVEIPAGYEVQVRPRSGLALNAGITCLNSPGTIDSDYRGEIKILLINFSQEPQSINSGDRIAQLVLSKTEKAVFIETDALQESVRQQGGFGHTGKN